MPPARRNLNDQKGVHRFMAEQEIWIIGTEPPCPRCDYLTRMVKDVVSDLQLTVPVRHLNYTGKEARQLAAACGLEPGTAKDVARRTSVDIDWNKVYALIGGPAPSDEPSQRDTCCPMTAKQWSPQLDELLRPCEKKAREAGIMMTPVLVIGGRCVHEGSVPGRELIVNWVRAFCGGGTEIVPDNRRVAEVLGPGCAKCDQLYQNVLEALARADLSGSVTVKKRSDLGYFQKMGVTVTPALAIDGRVLSTGRVLTPDQIVETLLQGTD
ncbi:MAG: MTH895/ArsE family thioredoxin-like protein [Desulfatirhabdiaceae bacterium]